VGSLEKKKYDITIEICKTQAKIILVIFHVIHRRTRIFRIQTRTRIFKIQRRTRIFRMQRRTRISRIQRRTRISRNTEEN